MARKKAQAFRTITEVSDWLDTPSHVLRFWESKFSQIKPVKRAGGRRYYRPEDLKLIGGIKVLLHDDGNTIASVQDLIKEKGEEHIESFSPEPVFALKGRRRSKSKAKASSKTAKAEVSTDTKDATEVHEVSKSTKSKPASQSAPGSTTEPLQMGAPVEKDQPLQMGTPVKKDEPLQMSAPVEKVPPLQLGETAPVDSSKETEAKSRIEDAISEARSKETSTSKDVVDASSANLTDDQLLEIEGLFFELQSLRNRMRRGLKSL